MRSRTRKRQRCLNGGGERVERAGVATEHDFGDVFGYALATERRMPLPFKGHDVSHTDVMTAGA